MKDMSKRILLARCKNCENQYWEHGKRCAWRSLGNEYCFDGMSNEEAHEEIDKHFKSFQTQIATELV
jgi:hypothetical protein